jgi:hypothetical protein
MKLIRTLTITLALLGVMGAASAVTVRPAWAMDAGGNGSDWGGGTSGL